MVNMPRLLAFYGHQALSRTKNRICGCQTEQEVAEHTHDQEWTEGTIHPQSKRLLFIYKDILSQWPQQYARMGFNLETGT